PTLCVFEPCAKQKFLARAEQCVEVVRQIQKSLRRFRKCDGIGLFVSDGNVVLKRDGKVNETLTREVNQIELISVLVAERGSSGVQVCPCIPQVLRIVMAGKFCIRRSAFEF